MHKIPVKSKFDKGYSKLGVNRPNKTHSYNEGPSFCLFSFPHQKFILKLHTTKAQHLAHMLPPPFFPLNKCTLNSLFLFLKLIYLFCCAAAKSLQSCPILCDPIDGNPPGSPIPGILQARTLEWVAISFSNA